jgi:hypothetical protein
MKRIMRAANAYGLAERDIGPDVPGGVVEEGVEKKAERAYLRLENMVERCCRAARRGKR